MGHHGRDIPGQPQVGGVWADGQFLLAVGLHADQVVRHGQRGIRQVLPVRVLRRVLRGRPAIHGVHTAGHPRQVAAGDPGHVAGQAEGGVRQPQDDQSVTFPHPRRRYHRPHSRHDTSCPARSQNFFFHASAD